jgi:hypothetical protein
MINFRTVRTVMDVFTVPQPCLSFLILRASDVLICLHVPTPKSMIIMTITYLKVVVHYFTSTQ